MKIISLFNNKGGVGKTTLAYHLSCALAEQGNRVLMIDLDPQCNLTLFGMDDETLHHIWEEEDGFVDDFETTANSKTAAEMRDILNHPHTIHFLLKPTEDGQGEFETMPPVVPLSANLSLIPGRLTVYQYESRISERWSDIYRGDALAIRTVTRIRSIAEYYGQRDGYDFIIIDTSPSLGSLNKTIISTVDGFVIPALPDMFSLYGIRNIGNSLREWKREFDTVYSLLSEAKRSRFPSQFVRFLGYTIYNAKKYTKRINEWDLARAHYNYARQIPDMIRSYISEDVRSHLSDQQVTEPIGGTAVMHTHNTLPNMAQKYKCPIWKVPDCPNLDQDDKGTILLNKNNSYYPARQNYIAFSQDFLNRINTL